MALVSLQILQAVFESTADGLLIVDVDGKVIQFNSRFQSLWKIPQDLLDTHEDEVLLKFILDQLIDPEAFLKKVRELYGCPDSVSNDQIEFKDGRFFERYSRPLKMHDHTMGRIWSFRDVTEQKRSQEIFTAITELSPDVISIINHEGKLVFNSKASEWIHGYTPEDLENKNTFDFIHVDDRESTEHALEKLFEQPGLLLTVQYRYRNKDGSYSWMEASASNQIQNPLIKGVVVISREIGKRKKLEEDLNDALRLRDDFISIASHELKTPITSLKLQLQMMKRLKLPSTKKYENVDNLLDQINILHSLIDDLLDVSKIRTGHLNLNFEFTDLSEILERSIDRFILMLQQAGCKLTMNIQKNIVGPLDKTKIEQVFANLISNAIKYAPGTQIEIQLEKKEDHAEFTICDYGPGIPLEKHDIIFERFERASKLKNTTGLGIGLYISKYIVEAHGGSMKVISEPGKGSIFIVRLKL